MVGSLSQLTLGRCARQPDKLLSVCVWACTESCHLSQEAFITLSLLLIINDNVLESTSVTLAAYLGHVYLGQHINKIPWANHHVSLSEFFCLAFQ